jgi:hypothetical protein
MVFIQRSLPWKLSVSSAFITVDTSHFVDVHLFLNFRSWTALFSFELSTVRIHLVVIRPVAGFLTVRNALSIHYTSISTGLTTEHKLFCTNLCHVTISIQHQEEVIIQLALWQAGLPAICEKLRIEKHLYSLLGKLMS